MAPKNDPKSYFRTQVLTAPPERLLLMMYDGAIRFCRTAAERIEAGESEESHALLVRAQGVVLELLQSLDREIAPELCGKLAGLYHYVYMLLIRANTKKEVAAIEEGVGILETLRGAWMEAIDKDRREYGAARTKERHRISSSA